MGFSGGMCFYDSADAGWGRLWGQVWLSAGFAFGFGRLFGFFGGWLVEGFKVVGDREGFVGLAFLADTIGPDAVGEM